jgi:hypothetical protein
MEDEPQFSIPEPFIEKLYEFSGGAEKYKGIVLAICSENGNPMIYSKFDSAIVELGLKKAIEDFIKNENIIEE